MVPGMGYDASRRATEARVSRRRDTARLAAMRLAPPPPFTEKTLIAAPGMLLLLFLLLRGLFLLRAVLLDFLELLEVPRHFLLEPASRLLRRHHPGSREDQHLRLIADELLGLEEVSEHRDAPEPRHFVHVLGVRGLDQPAEGDALAGPHEDVG